MQIISQSVGSAKNSCYAASLQVSLAGVLSVQVSVIASTSVHVSVVSAVGSHFSIAFAVNADVKVKDPDANTTRTISDATVRLHAVEAEALLTVADAHVPLSNGSIIDNASMIVTALDDPLNAAAGVAPPSRTRCAAAVDVALAAGVASPSRTR